MTIELFIAHRNTENLGKGEANLCFTITSSGSCCCSWLDIPSEPSRNPKLIGFHLSGKSNHQRIKERKKKL
jgi:hypothetical protein